MPRKTGWNEEEIAQLRHLVAVGASAFRAVVALKRSRASVQNKAREIGSPFPAIHQSRKRLRLAAGALTDGRKR